MRRIISFAYLLCGFPGIISAASVDTVQTYSESMQKTIKAVVITPDSYHSNSAGEFPVLYLLHGYSGNYADWILKDRELGEHADRYDMIIVCPDGGYNSWYFDSPVNKSSRYETYISQELVKWVDAKYKTIKNSAGRAITGLSMGGHGALYLAFRHQDVYGAAGSMSGGVDIRPFPGNWDLSEKLGSYAENPENWNKNTVVNMVHLLKPDGLSLIFDCGTADFFYEVNLKLHKELEYRNVPHDFVSRPGKHDWNYWNNSIKYQLVFFDAFFKGHPNN